jgi:hypothetical protein
MKELNQKEIEKLCLGFVWNPSMSFKEFEVLNNFPSKIEAYEIFKQIEDRYVQFMYEKEE